MYIDKNNSNHVTTKQQQYDNLRKYMLKSGNKHIQLISRHTIKIQRSHHDFDVYFSLYHHSDIYYALSL